MKKYKKGYTTGVFDMFHVGHLNILEKSKELCDYLVVGVTTDELVSYKGTKSIINQEDRKKIISSIKYVDETVYQTTMDKFKAWEILKFDVMFVGSDWKDTEKWNNIERTFNKFGVDIIYFDYTKGISTAELKEKLRQIYKI